jgi:hypothetical protein
MRIPVLIQPTLSEVLFHNQMHRLRLSRLQIPTIALAPEETVIRASQGTMRACRALYFSEQAPRPGVQDPGSQCPTSHHPMAKVVKRPSGFVSVLRASKTFNYLLARQSQHDAP